MKWTSVRSPVPEENDRHLVGLPELDGEACAYNNRKSSGDHSVGPKNSYAEVCNVHGAAFAFTVACGLAEELGEHELRVSPFGNEVAMASMSACHIVLFSEHGTRAHRGSLLADGKVNKSRNQILLEKLAGFFLKSTDQNHFPEKIQFFLLADFHFSNLLEGKLI
jgi:hypothetical protein